MVTLNIWLDESIVELLLRRAGEEGKTPSRYLADLIAADARRRQEELAGEGYRLLEADTAAFAEAAWPLAAENWPEWEDSTAELPPEGKA